jgi:hypothetical protein
MAKAAASTVVFFRKNFLSILILPRLPKPRATRSNDRPGAATIGRRPPPHDED